MAETFRIGTHVTALWGHRWYAGVVDDILDGGRAYEIAWADEETCNEVPAADVQVALGRGSYRRGYSAAAARIKCVRTVGQVRRFERRHGVRARDARRLDGFVPFVCY